MGTPCLPRHQELILLLLTLSPSRSAGMYVYGYDATLNARNSFPVFSTHIEVNYVSKKEDIYSAYALTDEDRASILLLAKDPRIGEKQGRVPGVGTCLWVVAVSWWWLLAGVGTCQQVLAPFCRCWLLAGVGTCL